MGGASGGESESRSSVIRETEERPSLPVVLFHEIPDEPGFLGQDLVSSAHGKIKDVKGEDLDEILISGFHGVLKLEESIKGVAIDMSGMAVADSTEEMILRIRIPIGQDVIGLSDLLERPVGWCQIPVEQQDMSELMKDQQPVPQLR